MIKVKIMGLSMDWIFFRELSRKKKEKMEIILKNWIILSGKYFKVLKMH